MQTHLCDLLGIDFPIIQAGMGSFTSAELVSEVSNAGALGSLGTGGRSVEDLRYQLSTLNQRTNKPFAINHVMTSFNEKAFKITLDAKPALISFALGDPGDLVRQAHDADILVMHQVTTVEEAKKATELEVDIINAQGGEAGGYCGTVGGLSLVPQVVDAVSPIPVVASGGVADGRTFAAALALGAQGVNLGTRFLASFEAPISKEWKQKIIESNSEDAIKFGVWRDIFPPRPGEYLSTPRVLKSPFVTKWLARRESVKRESKTIQEQIMNAVQAGKLGELLPFAGQSAGMINEILLASVVVQRLIYEAQKALEAIKTI